MLRVLTKPGPEKVIVVNELLQIMENVGLVEDDEDDQDDGQDDYMDDQNQDEEEEAQAMEEQQQPKPKKKGKQLDLSKLDQKSLNIMLILMMTLMESNISEQEFFEDVIFEQKVKSSTKNFTMQFIKAPEFFRVLREKEIYAEEDDHHNLQDFLKLNAENPELLLVKHIRKIIE